MQQLKACRAFSLQHVGARRCAARPLRFATLAVTVLSIPALAHADDDEAARLARNDVGMFAYRVGDATKNGMFGNNFALPASDCTAAIKRGNDAGVSATDTYDDGMGNTSLWKRAPELCAQYAKLQALGATIDLIRPQLQTIDAFMGPDGKPDKSITGDAFRETVKVAQTCVATIDQAIHDGVVADVAFAPNGNIHDTLITLTEARTRCKGYVDWGGKAAVADDNRQAEEQAALKAKWRKLGARGDRLKYLVENGHHIILGKGCRELDDKGKTTSSVLYEVYSDDAWWTVYKTQWKKDKKTKSSERRFRRDGGYSCK